MWNPPVTVPGKMPEEVRNRRQNACRYSYHSIDAGEWQEVFHIIILPRQRIVRYRQLSIANHLFGSSHRYVKDGLNYRFKEEIATLMPYQYRDYELK